MLEVNDCNWHFITSNYFCPGSFDFEFFELSIYYLNLKEAGRKRYIVQLVSKRVGLARFFDHAYAYTDMQLDLLLGGAFCMLNGL